MDLVENVPNSRGSARISERVANDEEVLVRNEDVVALDADRSARPAVLAVGAVHDAVFVEVSRGREVVDLVVLGARCLVTEEPGVVVDLIRRPLVGVAELSDARAVRASVVLVQLAGHPDGHHVRPVRHVEARRRRR